MSSLLAKRGLPLGLLSKLELMPGQYESLQRPIYRIDFLMAFRVLMMPCLVLCGITRVLFPAF